MPCSNATSDSCTGYSTSNDITEAIPVNLSITNILLGALSYNADSVDLNWTAGEAGGTVELMLYDVTGQQINDYDTPLVSAGILTLFGDALVLNQYYFLFYRVLSGTECSAWDVLYFEFNPVDNPNFIIDGTDYILDGPLHIVELRTDTGSYLTDGTHYIVDEPHRIGDPDG